MNWRFALIFFSLLYLSACNAKNAFEYSQQIVKMETKLAAEIAEADQKVSKYLEADQHDSAILFTQQMEDLATHALEQVEKLKAPDVEEADNFKRAAIRYFTYLKTIYSSFNRFSRATNEQVKEAERQRLSRIVADKEDATNALQQAQQKFARANHFRIEKVKTEN